MLEQGMKGWNLWQLPGMLAFHPDSKSGKNRQKKYAIEQEFLQALLMSELKMTW